MIYATVNMTIGDYSSTCDNKILLYRGDKNVEIRIVMKGNKFTVLDSTYAQMIIRRPSATSVFSEPAPIQNDTVVFVITEDMIDELKEIGEYTFQVRLYDDTMTARATLPPCKSALIIERPIAVEGEAAVNLAMVNDSAVMLADTTISEEDIFTEDNKYNRTIWVDGDLITDARLNKIEDALYYINENGGGGGGSATAPYISTELPETVMVGSDENFNLHLFFNSPNMGKGTLRVFINDADVMSLKIDQGDSTTVVSNNLFAKGTNRVVVYVLDRVGVMSNSLVFYIRYGSTEISSDFDPYSAYDYGATIRYYFTPTALDTSLSLTFYMSIDGQVQQGVNCTSDTRGYYTFPTNLSADSHYCEAYVVDSKGVKSNVLSFNLIILDADTLVVASDTKEVSVEEGEQVSLDYKVYMKYNTTFIANIYVDDALVNTGTCNADFNYYKTSSLTKGVHTVKLEVFDVTETHSDYITWTVAVSDSTYEMLQPVNAGAMFIGTAVNKTNTDERKQYFIGHDQEGNEVLGTLTNFAFNSESGWVNDELIISGNSHVEIPVQPLANNAKYGFTLDIEFTSKQIGVPDAEVLTLWNDETNCGIKITTEKLILQSSNGNKCDLYFTDNERTHVMFVIDRQELKAKIYLNGVMCEAFHLNDYTVEGVAYLDDFTVNSNIILGGLNTNGYCKIRNLRVYQVALTTDEIMNNFISCEIDKAKQRELSEFQKGNNLPTLYVYCDFSGLGKDDKKPCKIVYNSTNEALYGKSFNLDHKQSQLQYQGTSSMAYPIKNYRLNLRDENGDKWYYTLPTAQPECRFTLKADFMSSGHWTNTGMAKFINDKLYNYNVNDEKSMNPFKWDHVQNGGKVTDFRETISGFPCRLILVNDGETPLNTGQNEPTPGNTKDMGIFNFNNDKDNVTTLGFNSDIFPNCASYEVTANSDTSAGAFMSYVKSKNIFKHENAFKGHIVSGENTPCEIQTYNGEKVYCAAGSTPENSTFKILNCFKENTVYTLQFDYTVPDSVGWAMVYIRYTDGTAQSLAYKGVVKPTITSNTGKTIKQIDFINPGTCYIYSDSILLLEGDIPEEGGVDELAYLKESFELRHPDKDDVAEDWGFMGVETTVKYLDYWITSDKMTTTTFSYSDTSIEVTGADVSYISCYGENGYIASASGSNGIYTMRDGTTKIGITFTTSNIEKFYINGVMYIPGTVANINTIRESYDSIGFDTSYGLKALIDWVDNCTDEEFVADFEEHFHKDYTLRYFCLVTLIGAVDNLGKNMMLDTADNKIFFPRFYDIDTICSYDNSGQLKFDVDIEMEQGYWNTSSSRLWTRVRDLMHDDIVATYNDMRQNGVSYENMMHYIYDEQIAKIPQAYYNKDYDVKYAPFADSYIGMAHGDTYEHVKRWLKQRFAFVDTLFDYAPSYNNDILTIRVNTTEEITLHLETYTPVYQHLSWYNGQMDKKKIDGKTSITFSGKVQAATDQEVLIYGGSNIKKITGIQSGNPNRLILGSATKLTELDASNCPLLAEINMNKANLSPHEYLNKVNLSNCPLLEGNLRLNNSPLIQELDIRGTGITGMNLPSSIRNLQVLKLPNTMTELTLNDAGMLHTLEFDEGVKMQSVAMTNCNALENVINFDLLQTPSITLNNSYNTAAELYFRDTTNLSLSNMPNLERVIFTPNNEYETFELINVANAPDYKVTTFNCPKLSTFMTTAPYRESYNNCGMTTKSVPTGTLVYKDFSPNGTAFNKVVSFDYYNDVIEAEIDLTNCDATHTNENILSFAITESALGIWGLDSVIHIYYTPSSKTLKFSYRGNIYYIDKIITDTIVNIKMNKGTIYLNNEIVLEGSIIESIFSPSTTIVIGSIEGPVRSTALYKLVGVNYDEIDIEIKDYGDIQPNTTFTANSIDISSTQFTDVKLLCTTDTNTLKLPTTVKNFYCDSSFDLDTDYLEDGEYDVVHGELVEPYTTDYEGEVIKAVEEQVTMAVKDLDTTWKDGYFLNVHGDEIASSNRCITDFIRVSPNSLISMPSGNFAALVQYDINKKHITGGAWVNNVTLDANCAYVRLDFVISDPPFGRDDGQTLTFTPYVECAPNLVPSSADGSLIFSMYAPSNAVAPASGTWDLHGLEFDNFHTFGMNNDVKPSEDSYVKVYNGKNLKLFQGGVYRNNPSGSVFIDENQAYRRVLSPIYLPKGSHTYAYSNGSNSTKYYVTELNGSKTQSLEYGHINITSEEGGYAHLTYDTNDPNYPKPMEWIKIDDVYYMLKNVELITFDDISNGFEYSVYDYIDGEVDSRETSMMLMDIKSLTMPSRYDDYNITIKNAYIKPTTHNTMLYPLLVNEDNPITGTLDYTDYAGKHLSWSFAYTDEEFVNIIQPKDELLNSYEYRYNAFYDTEYEFDNPYEIARYTANATGVLPNFNAGFTYTYDEINNGDGTYTTKIYTNDLDILPTSFSFYTKSALLSVERMNVSRVTSAQGMFYQCSNLTYINSSNWNTSSMTAMNSMFNGCTKLTSLDVSGFDTSNVTNMHGMFSNCSGLSLLDVSGFDTKNVTNMKSMFNRCSKLTSLDVSGFDTSNVTNMLGMFSGCSGITSLDVSGFDTIKVTNMNNMFSDCKNLTSLDTSSFNTSNVTDMESMFYGCRSLKEVKGIENWDCSKVDKFGSMFQGATAFGGDLDLRNWKVGQNVTVTSIYSFMNGCANLKSVDMSGWVLPDRINFANFMANQGSLHTVRVIGWSSTNIQNLCGAIGTYVGGTIYGDVIIDETYLQNDWVYDNALVIAKYTANATGVLPGFNTDFTGYTTGETNNGDGTYTVSIATDSLDNLPTLISFTANTNLLTVDKLNTSKVTTMLQMFRSCENLTRINCRLDTSSVKDELSQAFMACKKLEYLDMTGFVNSNIKYATALFQECEAITHIDGLDTWDISSITDFSSMFANCYALSDLTAVENWDMSNAKVLDTMFARCNAIESFDLTKWDVRNVTNMRYMFGWARGPVSIDMTGWDTSNVENMYYMFGFCNKLTEIKGLENFNTSKVTNMQYMLCEYKATELDLSRWDVGNVTNMCRLFEGCVNLQSLNISGWKTSNVTNMQGMFNNCPSLTELDLSGFDTSNVTDMSNMFRGCRGLTHLDISGNYVKRSELDDVISQLNELRSDVDSLLQNNGGEEVLYYDPTMSIENDRATNGFDTKNVTNMESMFHDCSNLTELDLSTFDTSNVTNMGYMFYGCSKLTSLDLSKWDASKVENMNHAFCNCSSITELNLSRFTNVKDWGSFCRYCTNLVSITGLDISKYSTNFGGNDQQYLSFQGCTSLRSIKDLNVSFTSAMAKANSNSINNDYWMLCGWGWFNGLTNLVDITFTGQVELYDTMLVYYIFKGCDTTKFTQATWNTFVSIFPTTSTSKSIVLGGTQAILEAVPDEIKLALTQKGYTLIFRD